jgi:hypothetical protein
MSPWYDLPEPAWRTSLKNPAEWQKVAQKNALAHWLGASEHSDLVLGVRKGSETVVGIPHKDRSRHCYIVGASGSGKTTLLTHMVQQDMEHGRGFAVIDPLGPLIERVLPLIPKSRVKDTVYFNPADRKHPISLNPFIAETEPERERVGENFMVLFKRLFNVGDAAPRLLDMLRHAVRSLLESGNKTFLDLEPFLTDSKFRDQVLADVRNPLLLKFWENRFPTFPKNATEPILNKLGQFSLNSVIRKTLNRPESSIDFAEIMRSGKFFLADLAESKIDPENSLLLGSIITSMVQLATMRRRGTQAPPLFTIYVDEFQNVLGSDSSAFQKILSQARNYNVSLVLAHQYISQIPREMRSAILGNVHTMLAFRLGPEDARLLQAAFADAIPDKAAPKFLERLQNLSRGEAIVRYETATNNFVIRAYPPVHAPSPNFVREVVDYSRTHYGRHKAAASHPASPQPDSSPPPPPSQPHPSAEAPPESEMPAQPPEPEIPPINPWKAKKRRT